MKLLVTTFAFTSLLISAGPAFALCAQGEPCLPNKPIEPAPDAAAEAACKKALLDNWQKHMPSLGFASGLAAKAIDAALETLVNQAGLDHTQYPGGRWPGITVAISQGDKLVFAKSYGFGDMQSPELAHPDDLFRLESDSKQLTGATILKLIHDGQSVDGDPNHKLTMDTKIFEVIAGPPNAITPPGGAAALNPALKDLTVREAMYHTTGWIGAVGDPVWYAGQPNAVLPVTEKAVVETMETMAPGLTPPGKTFSYNNFEYNLLATLIGKITGQDYESVVRDKVLAPIGVTRTRVGESLYSLPNEAHYYAAVGSTSAPSLFPAVTGPQLTTDATIPYGSWSLQAGRGAGGWIASAPDTLRFQLAVNGRGPMQVYPNILADINTSVDQPSLACDPSGCGTLDPIDPANQRYNAGWGIHFWGQPFNGWELDHSGGVNGGISVSESIPSAPNMQNYGLVVLMNTSTPPQIQSFDPAGAIRNAMTPLLNANNGSLLDPGAPQDADFFDQYGDFTAFLDFQQMEARIAQAKQGCTYKGKSYHACYPSRLEGKSEVAGALYHAEIVPLHEGDSYEYLLDAPCTLYQQTDKILAQKKYSPVNLQWFSDQHGEMRVQAVWVQLRE